MQTWYEVCPWSIKITPIEVVRETDAMLILSNGRKRAKHGNYGLYFATWQQAKDCIVNRATRSLESTKKNLETAERELREAKLIKPLAES